MCVRGEPVARLHGYFGPMLPGPEGRRKSTRTVRFSRQNRQHHLSRQLADDNQAVCAEDLNVKGMLKD